MKYYYEKSNDWTSLQMGTVYTCDHPLFNAGTLYKKDDKGLIVVQQRYNKNAKVTWWGPIDPWLVDDITRSGSWDDWFNKNAQPMDENGLYPVFPIRKVMWAMRMKPLKREIFEQFNWR